MNIVRIVIGVLLLLFGRKLFWLFVGLLGFIVTFDLVSQALSVQPQWVVLVIAVLAGLLGALLAVALERVAVAVVGFLAGGYLIYLAFLAFGANPTTLLAWILILLGAVFGAVLAFAALDWALIVLSSLAGAGALVQGLALGLGLSILIYFGALVAGILVQWRTMARE